MRMREENYDYNEEVKYQGFWQLYSCGNLNEIHFYPLQSSMAFREWKVLPHAERNAYNIVGNVYVELVQFGLRGVVKRILSMTLSRAGPAISITSCGWNQHCQPALELGISGKTSSIELYKTKNSHRNEWGAPSRSHHHLPPKWAHCSEPIEIEERRTFNVSFHVNYIAPCRNSHVLLGLACL